MSEMESLTQCQTSVKISSLSILYEAEYHIQYQYLRKLIFDGDKIAQLDCRGATQDLVQHGNINPSSCGEP